MRRHVSPHLFDELHLPPLNSVYAISDNNYDYESRIEEDPKSH